MLELNLAGAGKLIFVKSREAKIANGVMTAISKTGRGSGETRGEESTAIHWTLWGKQVENAAEYLGKGSHGNIVGRMRTNNYQLNVKRLGLLFDFKVFSERLSSLISERTNPANAQALLQDFSCWAM